MKRFLRAYLITGLAVFLTTILLGSYRNFIAVGGLTGMIMMGLGMAVYHHSEHAVG